MSTLQSYSKGNKNAMVLLVKLKRFANVYLTTAEKFDGGAYQMRLLQWVIDYNKAFSVTSGMASTCLNYTDSDLCHSPLYNNTVHLQQVQNALSIVQVLSRFSTAVRHTLDWVKWLDFCSTFDKHRLHREYNRLNMVKGTGKSRGQWAMPSKCPTKFFVLDNAVSFVPRPTL